MSRYKELEARFERATTFLDDLLLLEPSLSRFKNDFGKWRWEDAHKAAEHVRAGDLALEFERPEGATK